MDLFVVVVGADKLPEGIKLAIDRGIVGGGYAFIGFLDLVVYEIANLLEGVVDLLFARGVIELGKPGVGSELGGEGCFALGLVLACRLALASWH